MDVRPRLCILTDIGGDPDDQQSLVRLLVYANEFDIEAIIPQHWDGETHGRNGRTPEQQMELVRDYIHRYGMVHANLSQHAAGYPSADRLEAVVKRGMVYVPAADDGGNVDPESIVGEGKDTEGSRWLINVVDRDDPRPVDIAVWGGPADLAQALWRVRHDRTLEECEAFVSKIRVHAIGDQDVTGPWIRENFPSLFYVLSLARDQNKWNSCYRGMFLGGDESLTSRDWVTRNVVEGHGPLGEAYPLETYTGPNPHGCLKEGDTPSWLYFLRNGLNRPDQPAWGGWGGRFDRLRSYFRDVADRVGQDFSGKATVYRWRPAFQAEFAARMDWCVSSVPEANHPPIAVVNGDESKDALILAAELGSELILDAAESRDPDGDELSFAWWVYQEAGSYPGDAPLQVIGPGKASLRVPADLGKRDIHVILEVTDSGLPALTTYRRIVVRGPRP